ncbi:acylphosphatase [Bacteriovorax sp. Seq25_V]|uniref:acylphosphatase n=1 Tax=Bacteriovorax sp. Seq25_V TaxID=1201288 RepID=UPI00038A0B2D|nr:acylphosphatase [Bacteriovorax sp. Seq25_V]EQC45405.1 acylphosphatase [Bacteriovorax sp. Seq25_V]
MKVSFYVYGRVQAVMFRKTFCYGAIARKLEAGATNDRQNRERVLCSVCGDSDNIQQFLEELQTLDTLNSWGAKVLNIEVLEEFHDLEKHEITTTNVDHKPRTQDIEFFL